MLDLQSDHVNMPTDEMWDTMRATKAGWAVGGKDPTVNRLQELAAQKTGKEAALLVMTGRMATLLGLMTCCCRGRQVVLEKDSHIVWGEEWGLAYVCGAFARLVEGRQGVMNPGDVERAITESRFKHTPVTDLVCLENTHNMAGGTVLTLAQTKALCDVAHRHGARILLDGARIFYAAVAQGLDVAQLAADADLVTFSLTKGLSAPAGAMLCGSRALIEEAYHNMRRIGAHSFHKAGILAAAGIVALEKMVARLADDIRRAKAFATAASRIPRLSVDLASVHTNIVMVDISGAGVDSARFLELLRQQEVSALEFTPEIIRFTFHRHIGDGDVATIVSALRSVVEILAR